MPSLSSLLLEGSIVTPKSGVLLENIDLVEFDGSLVKIRGYVNVGSPFSNNYKQRWTTIDTYDIDLRS